MRTARRPSRLLVALAATTALLAAGCSADGGSDDAGPTTTEATPTTDGGGTTTTEDDDGTTTTEGDDGTTTTEGTDDPGEGPTAAELEALLPVAADLGTGWSPDDEDEDDGDDTESDALDEQCPEVAELGLDDEDDGDDDDVVGSYADTEDRQLEVTLSPDADELDDADLEAFVEAINGCGTVTETDERSGITTDFAFEAQVDDTYGDQGIRVQADVTLSGGELPTDVTLVVYALIWRAGPVGVEVVGNDGLDTTTFEPVPFDTDLLVQVADDLDAGVTDLVG